MSAETRAALIVRGLFGTDDADDGHELEQETQVADTALGQIERAVRRTLQRIVDLADVLPLLAEAAPDEFLEAIARALQRAREAPDCLQVLNKGSAGPSSDAGWYGLSHALETLAWSPESGHLALVSDVLLTIAAIGNDDLAAKAHGCLVSLFRPWLPQSGAVDRPTQRSARGTVRPDSERRGIRHQRTADCAVALFVGPRAPSVWRFPECGADDPGLASRGRASAV